MKKLQAGSPSPNASSLPNPSPESHALDEASTPQFAIAVSATLQQRRTRALKHGEALASDCIDAGLVFVNAPVESIPMRT